MPIYEYRCENGHTFEAFQSMSDDALDTCEVCGAAAARVLSAPAVHFKGSGFYTTDYARKGAKKATADGGSSDSGAKESKDSKGSSGSDSDGKGGEGRSSDSSSKSSEKTASKSGSGE